MKRTVLVIDDEKSIRSSLQGVLEDEGFHTILAASGEDGLKVLSGKEEVDIVLLDIWLPGKDGLEILNEIRQDNTKLPVIMMTGHGNIETAVKAIKLGALDFIEKPLDLTKLIISISNALHMKALEEENAFLRTTDSREAEIIENSSAMKKLKQEIEVAAPSDAWILILGENGTGKELVARALHHKSTRAGNPFIEVNCAAIPEELIESELFGHEKGSFTGATERRRGKFDLADKGTLFLDEIGDMGLSTQAKILRILQEQRFERVGGSQTIEVDVRVITATNKDLVKEIREGRFRQDLYYRLNVIPITVPPLRQRKEDISALVDHFLQLFSPLNNGKKKAITDGALKKLAENDWPGNVRELKNIVERLVIMTKGEAITEKDIPDLGVEAILEGNELMGISLLKDARAEFEKQFIMKKLKENENNISKTADVIGLERSNLHKKLKSLGIDV